MSLLIDHFSVAHYEGSLNWFPRKAYCGDFTDSKAAFCGFISEEVQPAGLASSAAV